MAESRRLFYALWPDDRQRDRLRDVISPAVRLVDGRAVPRANWHLTLQFLGDVPEKLVPDLLEAIPRFAPPAFSIPFDRVEFWPRAKTACLVPSTLPSELARLHQQLKTLAGDLGLPVDDRQFRPHITVCRGARPFEKQRVSRTSRIEWSDFSLLESKTFRGEVSYHPVKQTLP